MSKPSGGIWMGVVTRALTEMGGRSSLRGLYDAVEGRRPTSNPFWREQIRKVVQSKRFTRTADNLICLAEAA